MMNDGGTINTGRTFSACHFVHKKFPRGLLRELTGNSAVTSLLTRPPAHKHSLLLHLPREVSVKGEVRGRLQANDKPYEPS